ncbi:SixA phosphatase family protein [Mesorhizobium sp. ES1-1]|uniref:SixA phosphatase family protein n=1 Tax=Mesorhizobium sp. ES1-1 TaxID=2876629 RepID=UPI001CD0101D|nr:histidine phosphatase family protein [Mesorhizobium sp. ES1-1]MBZ9677091.1 histidine phosphatase family protein [Mesorhizobium sp. ES1-1]
MSRLFLLRHARAGWALPGMRDFDRPLDASGRVEAEAIGAAMRARAYIPDITLCSRATRAKETLEALAGMADTGKVLFSDTLYSVDAAGYLRLIRDNLGPGSLLVIGHNPMMEDLAVALSGAGDETARAKLNNGFPTAGLAVIRFDSDLAKAAQGAGYLDAFLTPADF